jgi:hypothetical protein
MTLRTSGARRRRDDAAFRSLARIDGRSGTVVLLWLAAVADARPGGPIDSVSIDVLSLRLAVHQADHSDSPSRRHHRRARRRLQVI